MSTDCCDVDFFNDNPANLPGVKDDGSRAWSLPNTCAAAKSPQNNGTCYLSMCVQPDFCTALPISAGRVPSPSESTKIYGTDIVVRQTYKPSPTFAGTLFLARTLTADFKRERVRPKAYSHNISSRSHAVVLVTPRYPGTIKHESRAARSIPSTATDKIQPTSVPRNTEHRVDQKVRMLTEPTEHCPQSH